MEEKSRWRQARWPLSGRIEHCKVEDETISPPFPRERLGGIVWISSLSIHPSYFISFPSTIDRSLSHTLLYFRFPPQRRKQFSKEGKTCNQFQVGLDQRKRPCFARRVLLCFTFSFSSSLYHSLSKHIIEPSVTRRKTEGTVNVNPMVAWIKI